MIGFSRYIRPTELDNALSLLASGEFTPIAGGTDLIPQLRRQSSANLLDIADLGLDFIKNDDGQIEIGAGCSHTRLKNDLSIKDALPLLAKACSLIGSEQIRNRATIGGNIINASPCADTVPALLCHDTSIVLISKNGKREIKLSEFTLGPYLTQKKQSELLYSIKCIPDLDMTGFSFIKLGRRQAVNISRMTVALSISLNQNGSIDKARIAAGSVFAVTSRMIDLEKYLAGQSPGRKLFDEAGKLAADLMIRESGIRWSTPYKQPVLSGLMARALEEATAGAGNL